MAEIPEHLLRRSAEARAKATGRPVEEILAEMRGEQLPPPVVPPAEDEPEPAPPAPEPAAEAPAAEAPAPSTAAVPEKLLRRSAEARAKATGRPVEEILAEMRGEELPPPAEPAAEAEPEPEPVAATPEPVAEAAPEPVAEAPAPEPAAAAPAPSGNGGIDWSQLEGKVPEILIERSRAARAKADGVSVAPAATSAAPSPVAAAAGGPAAAPAAPAAPAIPEGVRTQRLLTVVKAGAIQQVKAEPSDKVNVWPHLIAAEFVALLAVTAALTIFSVFVDAPLLELANFNEQPNPSKAPWYFLGLQELLSYFDPQVAGVLIPGLGLGGLAVIPYIDRNPSVKPADRKLAIMIFTFFLMASTLLTIWGSFFRGPGFNFTFPWDAGLFFDF